MGYYGRRQPLTNGEHTILKLSRVEPSLTIMNGCTLRFIWTPKPTSDILHALNCVAASTIVASVISTGLSEAEYNVCFYLYVSLSVPSDNTLYRTYFICIPSLNDPKPRTATHVHI